LRRRIPVLVAVAVVAAACASQPETCDEVADESIELMQALIDEVESEVGEMSVQELIDETGDDLPSVAAFERDAARLSDRASELGCTQDQLEAAVADRTDRLHATTPIGQFLVNAIKGGGI
jgi:hypothetical protein